MGVDAGINRTLRGKAGKSRQFFQHICRAVYENISICGLAPGALKGRLFTDCLINCNKSCQAVLEQTLGLKKHVKDYRVKCGLSQRPDQKVSISAFLLLNKDGRSVGAVLVIQDITLLKRLQTQLRERRQYQPIIGKSKKMKDISDLLEKLADVDTTVLVTGESGTGKELIARALHYSSHRASEPFITVNCFALAESLLEPKICNFLLKEKNECRAPDRKHRFK